MTKKEYEKIREWCKENTNDIVDGRFGFAMINRESLLDFLETLLEHAHHEYDKEPCEECETEVKERVNVQEGATMTKKSSQLHTEFSQFMETLSKMSRVRYDVIQNGGGADVRIHALGEYEGDGKGTFHFDEKRKMSGFSVEEE